MNYDRPTDDNLELRDAGRNRVLLSTPIVLWSADYLQTTGQAIVTRQVVSEQSRIRWIPAVYSTGRWLAVLSVFRALLVLWGALLARRAQTVYLVCSRSEGGFVRDIPALLPAFFGVRVIVHAHGSDIVDLLCNRRTSPVARLLYSRCELIVPSLHLVPSLEKFKFHGLHICENFCPRIPSHLVSTRPDMVHELTVLWNSNIISSKGFFEVANGIRLAREQGHEVHFVVLGTPMGDAERTRSQMAAEVDQLRQNSWVTYFGPVAPKDAARQTAAADVVLLPSRYESECQPLAVIQAMCLGKQVIAADTPALRATLRDYPAVLLRRPTPSAIADALADALHEKRTGVNEDDKRFCHAAVRARERFSTERFNAQMAVLLEGRELS